MLGIDVQGLHFFALVFHWYAILVVAAAWLGVEVASRLAARIGQDGENAWRALIWVALFGLIGARAWFVLFPPTSYVDNGLTAGWMLAHFFDLNQGAIAVWSGGMSLIGAILGGVAGLYFFTRAHRLPLPVWLDIAALALPLAQAVERISNLIEANLYGPPTKLPWGMLVNDQSQRIGPYTNLSRYPLATTTFQPVALYELLFVLVLFVVLEELFRRFPQSIQPGDIALIYVIVYGIGRFLLESMRVNVSQVGSMNISQGVAGVAVITASLVLVDRIRKPNRPSYRNSLVASDAIEQ